MSSVSSAGHHYAYFCWPWDWFVRISLRTYFQVGYAYPYRKRASLECFDNTGGIHAHQYKHILVRRAPRVGLCMVGFRQTNVRKMLTPTKAWTKNNNMYCCICCKLYRGVSVHIRADNLFLHLNKQNNSTRKPVRSWTSSEPSYCASCV